MGPSPPVSGNSGEVSEEQPPVWGREFRRKAWQRDPSGSELGITGTLRERAHPRVPGVFSPPPRLPFVCPVAPAADAAAAAAATSWVRAGGAAAARPMAGAARGGAGRGLRRAWREGSGPGSRDSGAADREAPCVVSAGPGGRRGPGRPRAGGRSRPNGRCEAAAQPRPGGDGGHRHPGCGDRRPGLVIPVPAPRGGGSRRVSHLKDELSPGCRGCSGSRQRAGAPWGCESPAVSGGLCRWGGLGAAGCTLPGGRGNPALVPGSPGARQGRVGRGAPVVLPAVALVLSESPLLLWVPAVVVFFRRYSAR